MAFNFFTSFVRQPGKVRPVKILMLRDGQPRNQGLILQQGQEITFFCKASKPGLRPTQTRNW